MPRLQSLTDTRGVVNVDAFRAGSYHLRAHGTPDPGRAIVRTRRARDTYRPLRAPKAVRPADCSPREHAEHVRQAEHNMDVLRAAVQEARACGDELARAAYAERARQARAILLELTGGIERRVVEVDQGSAVNPMIAV
jgi:hypothetical protein